MNNPDHQLYMERCIQLARLGAGSVAPNPMVGAVVVHNGRIIGEGFHRVYGGPHAEVNAIAAVHQQSLPAGSTLYVNLEPCAHQGKTPPCADLIIKSKIPHVVIGCRDPFDAVNGKGIEKLKAENVMVTTGILEKESLHLNRRFITFHEKKRPYIILKWAQSKDGFIGHPDKRVLISNEYANRVVHHWRSSEQAIMVGTGTALLDDPQLTARLWPGNNPLRLVIDRYLRLPGTLKIFNEEAPTVIFNEIKDSSEDHMTCAKISFDDFPASAMHYLYERNILSVIIEGGAQLLHSFIKSNCWDEARVITSDRKLINGIPAPVLSLLPSETEKIENNLLSVYRNSVFI
jgi:diaminohydroxyphosphoribosylaminopyrimidine deaminase / 5-amino-6-(5-phosphoribosylamino)uracil reductase